jgi:hypothetical protein
MAYTLHFASRPTVAIPYRPFNPSNWSAAFVASGKFDLTAIANLK